MGEGSVSEALSRTALFLKAMGLRGEEIPDKARKLLIWMRVGAPYLIMWLLIMEEEVKELLQLLKLELTWENLICFAEREDPSQIRLSELCWSRQLDFLRKLSETIGEGGIK